MKRSALLSCLAVWAVAACGAAKGTGDAASEFSVESSGAALTSQGTSAQVADLGLKLLDDTWSPLRDEGVFGGQPNVRFVCGASQGSCPTTTVSCELGRIRTVTLLFDASASCTDRFGESLKGTIVLTRVGEPTAPAWDATFQTVQRGALTFSGGVRVAKTGIRIFTLGGGSQDLQIRGDFGNVTQTGNCQDPGQVCRQNIRTAINLTLDRAREITLTFSEQRDSVTVGGQLGFSAGSTDITANVEFLGAARQRRTLTTQVSRDMRGYVLALAGLVYALPLGCSCPTAGRIDTPSIRLPELNADCGILSSSFGPGGTCAEPTLRHNGTGVSCDLLADALRLDLRTRCKAGTR